MNRSNTNRLDSSRLVEIDHMKAISIIGVIFIHMSFESRFTPSMLHWISVVQVSLGWCVLSFFFCSGLLSEKFMRLSSDAAKTFLKKRIVGLLLPYLTFNLLYKLLLYIISLSNFVQWTTPLPNSLIGALTFLAFPVKPQLYFLVYLLAISCLYYALLFLFRHHYFVGLFTLALCCLFYAIAPPLLKAHGKELILLPLYLLSYSSGVLMGHNLAGKGKKSLFYPMLLTSIALSCWKLSLPYVFVIIPLALFIILRKANYTIAEPKKNGKKISEFIAFIGKKSGAIYVWHAPVLMSFLSIVLTKLVGYNYLTIVALVFLSITFSCLLDFLVRKHKFLRLLRV